MNPRLEVAGIRFGRLVAIRPERRGRRLLWECRCDCGGSKWATASHLTAHLIASCGCLRAESTASAARANITHGMSETRVFGVWAGMKDRCLNQRSPNFKNYGARGITVCERWRSSFESFVADMGEPPEGAEIDRIDNDGHYSPGNCRWATPQENARNRRSTRLLTLDGSTKCITAWAADLGITHQALHRRISILGWPLDRALTTGRTR